MSTRPNLEEFKERCQPIKHTERADGQVLGRNGGTGGSSVWRDGSCPPSSVPPKVLEPVGRHFGVPDRVLDVLVAKVVLQGPRVVAIWRD